MDILFGRLTCAPLNAHSRYTHMCRELRGFQLVDKSVRVKEEREMYQSFPTISDDATNQPTDTQTPTAPTTQMTLCTTKTNTRGRPRTHPPLSFFSHPTPAGRSLHLGAHLCTPSRRRTLMLQLRIVFLVVVLVLGGAQRDTRDGMRDINRRTTITGIGLHGRERERARER